jgi:hypothetical protein
MMDGQPRKGPKWIADLLELVSGIRGLLLLCGIVAGGGSGWVLADGKHNDGVTSSEAAAIADSVTQHEITPLIQQAKRQDTALMRIFFRQDVQMSDAQKQRADSLMRAALKNINYGGSQ